jgi:DnaJ-class molecular chaperone
MKQTIINEYQAAALVAMSPTLLRSFTSYAAKYDDTRKLLVAYKKDDSFFFDKEEILDFDKWLRQPWKPRPPETRPRVPTYIEDEIKVEANGECAICLANSNSCEAAHIDPVSMSKCNHPHNLIWLCANHHTKFDKHHFGPKEEDKLFIVSFKTVLQRYKIMLWRGQADVSASVFEILDLCKRVETEMTKVDTFQKSAALESVAKNVLSIIPNIAPVSQLDKKFSSYLAAKLQTAALVEQIGVNSIQRELAVASELRDEYLVEAGLIQCPLCLGAGYYTDQECPICHGDGTIDKADSDIDLYPFDLVICPLTPIHARFESNDCPGCSGNNMVQRRFADLIDSKDYNLIDCQLCKGTGHEGHDDCRVCHGERKILKGHSDRIDFAQYEAVDCPLCDGKGREGYDDCRVCFGNRRIDRRYAESIDLTSFGEVSCPLCSGTGNYDYEDCAACGGNQTMTKQAAEALDLHSYEKINCPVCAGSGELYEKTCPPCRGNGRITRGTASTTSMRDYERVTCRRCAGSGQYRESDCYKCDGTGSTLRIDD